MNALSLGRSTQFFTLLSTLVCLACSADGQNTELDGSGGTAGSTGGASIGTGGAMGTGSAPGSGGVNGGTGGSSTGGDAGTGGAGTGGGGGASVPGFCPSFSNGSGTEHPCYIGNDSAAYCIDDTGATTALTGISGAAVNVTGQGFTTAACVVNELGAVHCGHYGTMTEVIASGATQVSGSLTGWCAIVGGKVQCGGEDLAAAPELGAETVTQVACYYHGCCAATADGKMQCWGDTTALGGTGDAVVEVPAPGGKKVLQLGPGQDHICAVFEGGQVQCWGKDWNKQLGGLGENSTTGQTLMASGALAVVGGQFHTCIALEDGTVQCVSGGQSEGAGLDLGTLSPVTGVTNAVALSAGKHYTCALLADGKIKCWGRIGGGSTPIETTGPAAAACN